MTAKAYRIEWRPRACEYLRGIVKYIGMDSPARAKSFGKELRAKVSALAQHPELGHTGRLPGIHELIAHPSYIIFYRVVAEDRSVQILRAKHAAQQKP